MISTCNVIHTNSQLMINSTALSRNRRQLNYIVFRNVSPKKTVREKTTDVRTLNLSKKSILLAPNEITSFTNTEYNSKKKKVHKFKICKHNNGKMSPQKRRYL